MLRAYSGPDFMQRPKSFTHLIGSRAAIQGVAQVGHDEPRRVGELGVAPFDRGLSTRPGLVAEEAYTLVPVSPLLRCRPGGHSRHAPARSGAQTKEGVATAVLRNFLAVVLAIALGENGDVPHEVRVGKHLLNGGEYKRKRECWVH